MISLFMNEEESDVVFEIEGQTIPAHKEILIQKSQYFANLFNSGMIESRQQVIKVPDCEYRVFQEFLRFLYCDEVKLETNLACKLLVFAEKHLKEDLRDKCLGFLTDNVNQDNVYEILDFAREHDISQLRSWCINFCINKIDLNSVEKLIVYLDQQSNSEFTQENIQLQDKALDVLLRRNNPKAYQNEDFIIKNIEVDTILRTAKFITSANYNKSLVSNDPDQSLMEKCIANLKKAAFRFVEENFLELRKRGIINDFPAVFFQDYAQFVTEELIKYKNDAEARSSELEENQHKIQVNTEIHKKKENQQKSDEESDEKENGQVGNMKIGQKRREAVQEESSEDNPKLKQSKKSPTME